MQDNEHSAWYYIKGGIFLIWFVGSIVALFLTAKTAPWLAVSVFGQYFLVFGLIALFSGIKDGNFNPVFLIFLFVGLLAVIFGVIMQFGSESAQATFKELIPYAGTSIFFVTGALLLLTTLVRTNREKKCTEWVRATCIDMKKRRSQTYDGSNRIMYYLYCPVFGFNYNGKSYEVSNNFFSRGVTAELGEQYDLYINPEHPKCFKEENESARQGGVELILGIFFILISSFVFVLLFVLG